LISFLQETLLAEIVTAFSSWSGREEELVSKSFSKIMTRFVEHSNSIVEEITQITSNLFDVNKHLLVNWSPWTPFYLH